MQRRNFLSLAAAAALPNIAFSQSTPMRLIVPFAVGGATDIVARVISDALGRELGRVVVVENRAGAGGSLGTNEVAKSPADGNTFGIATVSTHCVNPAVYRKLDKKLGYDPLKDFTPIGEIAAAAGVLVINPKLPMKSFAEFLKLAKANPGKYTYGSPGNGSLGHMNMEQLKASTGISLTHIPYRGASTMITDLMGGQIDVARDQVASSLPHIRSGNLRPLAVAWKERLPQLPDVPTFAELSLGSNNDASWFGLVAPAKLPADQLQKLSAALKKVLSQADVKERIVQAGMVATPTSPAEFQRVITEELEKMNGVAKAANITLD